MANRIGALLWIGLIVVLLLMGWLMTIEERVHNHRKAGLPLNLWKSLKSDYGILLQSLLTAVLCFIFNERFEEHDE